MTMTTRDASDTSVTFSLAELTKMEEERVRREDSQRARAREKEARERREAESARAAAEQARIAAEAEAGARRRREEAEEKLRAEARERAALEVARIEAEARVRLDADNAARAHELAVLRTRAEGGRRTAAHLLVAALALALCGSGAVAYAGNRRVATLEHDAAQLGAAQKAEAEERDRVAQSALSTLERRYAALFARPAGDAAAEARAKVESARAHGLDRGGLRAYADALDALEARLDWESRLAALDRRQTDLGAWATDKRRGEATAAVRAAAARARIGGDAELRAYEAALDQLRVALGQGPAKVDPVSPQQKEPVATRPCLEGDPMCHDGHIIH